LMRKCPCPVWVLKPGAEPRFRRILAAVDPKEFDEDANKLNHKIVQLASSLAQNEGAALHVVHAWSVVGKDAESLQSELTEQSRQRILDKHLAVAHGRTERLVAPYADRVGDLKYHIRRGEPWEVISHTERSVGADLIVMGTIADGRVPGYFISTNAEMVLRQATCSVLTIKPDNFVSPVPAEAKQVYA
ncbi:MAG: universal stress protein, partial [Rhodospirillaceae bacterium]